MGGVDAVCITQHPHPTSSTSPIIDITHRPNHVSSTSHTIHFTHHPHHTDMTHHPRCTSSTTSVIQPSFHHSARHPHRSWYTSDTMHISIIHIHSCTAQISHIALHFRHTSAPSHTSYTVSVTHHPHHTSSALSIMQPHLIHSAQHATSDIIHITYHSHHTTLASKII